MMKHTDRWTAQKIAQRIDLIKPLVYHQRKPLASFRYRRLSDSDSEPPVAPDVDDKDWPLIEPETYWGRWQSDYLLRTKPYQIVTLRLMPISAFSSGGQKALQRLA